eukprot:3032191-Pyramimonas_sp.AAC.1
MRSTTSDNANAITLDKLNIAKDAFEGLGSAFPTDARWPEVIGEIVAVKQSIQLGANREDIQKAVDGVLKSANKEAAFLALADK